MIFPPTPAPEPSRPSHPPGAGEEEISYLLATRVDFGSVKHHTAVNIITDGCAVLFESEIDDAGAEIPLISHFSAGAALTATAPVPMFSGENGAVW